MEPKLIDDVIRNIDTRLERVEQILPTLATKDELRDAVAHLATKDELRDAVAPLATKVELQDTASAIRNELREEGARTRRHFDVVAERLEGSIRLLAEGHEAYRESTDRRFQAVDVALTRLDRRVTRLEGRRRT